MPSKKFTKIKTQSMFDFTLLFVVLFLIVFGLVMIYSTSTYEAADRLGDSSYYLRHQAMAVIFGLVFAGIVTVVDYHFWRQFYRWGIGVSVIMIFLILTPLGMTLNGARRWIKVFGLSIQPAEIAKIAVILYLAAALTIIGKKRLATWQGFIRILFVPAVISAMVYLMTDNLSSAIIIAGIAGLMVFVADKDKQKYFLVALVGVVLVTIVVLIATKTDAGGFRMGRISTWLDPEADADGKGFQTLQALYAIGSGGLFGKGLGNSMQKLGTLPEAQNDMIFSIICEELGLFGAIAIIFLFILLIWRCFLIAQNAPDLFGAMLVTGVMSHFALQVLLNIAVVTNSIPNTGISLPFISYGGTSVMFLMIEIGLVLNVSKSIKVTDYE